MSLSKLELLLGWVRNNLSYGKDPTLEADLAEARVELTALREQAACAPRYGVPEEPAVWLGRYGKVDLWLRDKGGDQEVRWQDGPDQGWVWRPRQDSGLAERQEAWRRVDAYDYPPGSGELAQVAGHAKRLGVAVLITFGGCYTLADGDWYAPGLKGDLLTSKCTAATLLSELARLPAKPGDITGWTSPEAADNAAQPYREEPKQETLVEVAVEMRRLLDLGVLASEWDQDLSDRLDAAIAREREAQHD